MVERVATEKGTVFPHKLAVGIKGCARDWHNYLRMDEATYLMLLALVAPLIKKNKNSYFTSREAYGDFWQLVEATKISSFQLSYHHRRKKKLLVVYKKLYSIAIAIILVFHTNIVDTV
jgi:hypothetical protein